MGNILSSMATYVPSQERQAISRRTKAGLENARANGKRLGRPPRLTDYQVAAIIQDSSENMSLIAISRKTESQGQLSETPWAAHNVTHA